MKPTTAAAAPTTARPKSWIPFLNFAIVDTIPQELNLRDHMFPFAGAEQDKRFIWGLYGTMAFNQGLFLADAYARQHGKHALAVQGRYRLDNFELIRSQIDREMAEASGFVHLDRVKASFRDELKEVMMAKAQERHPGFSRAAYADKPIGDLVLNYPSLVRELFDYVKEINMVVHPVKQQYDSSDDRSFFLATMRVESKECRDRVMDAGVRYMEAIKVNY